MERQLIFGTIWSTIKAIVFLRTIDTIQQFNSFVTEIQEACNINLESQKLMNLDILRVVEGILKWGNRTYQYRIKNFKQPVSDQSQIQSGTNDD